MAHSHVLLRRVEDVGHAGALQVVQVTHRLPITDDNASADLNVRSVIRPFLSLC